MVQIDTPDRTTGNWRPALTDLENLSFLLHLSPSLSLPVTPSKPNRFLTTTITFFFPVFWWFTICIIWDFVLIQRLFFHLFVFLLFWSSGDSYTMLMDVLNMGELKRKKGYKIGVILTIGFNSTLKNL